MLRMGKGHHTLTCGACGAPLTSLKAIPLVTPTSKPSVSHQPAQKLRKLPKASGPKAFKKSKKSKGFFRKLAEEAFDLVEDIFD